MSWPFWIQNPFSRFKSVSTIKTLPKMLKPTLLLILLACIAFAADYKQQLLNDAADTLASGQEALKYMQSHNMKAEADKLHADLTELATQFVPKLKEATDDQALFHAEYYVLGAERRISAQIGHVLVMRSEELYKRADEAVKALEAKGKHQEVDAIKKDKTHLEQLTTQLKAVNAVEKEVQLCKETIAVQNPLEQKISQALGH